MSQLHLVQTGFIRPILDGLENSGVNLNKLLMSSGLRQFHLVGSEQYVPVHSMYSLFDELNRKEGIMDYETV